MPENPAPEIRDNISHKIEDNFRIWLDQFNRKTDANSNPFSEENSPNLKSESELNKDKDLTEKMDLYSFYEELCALRFEFRKNFQRSHESTSRFSEILDNFTQRLQELDHHNRQQSTTIEQNLEKQAKSKIFLPLIDIYDRLSRLKENLEKPLAPSSFWQRRQQIDELAKKLTQISEGFSILERHFALLLEKEGIHRQACTGKKFDPTTMTAIEVTNNPETFADQVVEEIAPGYSFNDSPLRLAKVIVNRN